MGQSKRKNLLLGLGNTILKDDGIGIYAVREIRAKHPQNGWDVEESSLSGCKLLDVILDYQNVLIVDSIMVEEKKPGEILKFAMEDLKTPYGQSPHYVGLPYMLQLAKFMKLNIPENIKVVAINVNDPYTIHEGLSPEIEVRLPDFIKEIESEMKTIL